MVVRNLARGIDPARVDLHVVTYRPIVAMDQLDEVPATIHPLGFTGNRLPPRTRLELMVGAARKVRAIRPAVVQVHSGLVWLGLLAWAIRPRTPVVVEVHDAPDSGRHGQATDRFEGWFVRRRGVTAVCHSTAVQSQTEAVWRLDPGTVRRFPLGIDTDAFGPVDEARRVHWRASVGIDPAATVVIAVGRNVPSKRLPLAIDAVASARAAGANVEFVFSGPDGDGLGEHAAARGIADHVHFLGGSLTEEELVLAVGSADILSSTSEYEGFGLTLAEGMACGLAVVAMSVGGVVDLVDDAVTGFLVESGDVDAFAEHLVELDADRDRLRRMGEAGRARAVERFSLHALAENFTQLYEELAGRRRAP